MTFLVLSFEREQESEIECEYKTAFHTILWVVGWPLEQHELYNFSVTKNINNNF